MSCFIPRLFLFLWISVVIAAAFVWVPPAEGFMDPEAARIIFFHVPCAWLATLGFVMSTVHAIRYLQTRNARADIQSSIAAEIGMLFCLLATVTGAIFAQAEWGVAWNWDPREISITVLLLIYAAYFALRASIEDPERRASLGAVYAILAFVTVPFLVFVIPHIPSLQSLHEDASKAVVKGHLSPEYRAVFFASLAGFTALFLWLYRLAVRVQVAVVAGVTDPGR